MRKKKLENLPSSLLAPVGAWIHEYDVKKKSATYRYAKWQSKKPVFECLRKSGLTCHKYIGRVSSTTGLGREEAVEIAYAALRNRQELEAIDKCLVSLEKLLEQLESKYGHLIKL
ncbi:MAG: hypothetical protein F6K24_33405 [Okeania sp. SIO2D1]|nr:hypothetical protein [Okeania sp. SIO2D1]